MTDYEVKYVATGEIEIVTAANAEEAARDYAKRHGKHGALLFLVRKAGANADWERVDLILA